MTEKYDLEDRLLEYAAGVIHVTESMKTNRAGVHVSDQLVRSGTSPYGHHDEEESAESRADFVHKVRVCAKELRESRRWLRLVGRSALIAKPESLEGILQKSDELIRIFAASIRTATNNKSPRAAK